LAELTDMQAEAKQGRYVSHFALAMIRAGLGDKDAAFAQLDSAVAERTWMLFTLPVEPAFDGLRADPRYPALLERIGLTS
jgi:hypothetical protein